MPKGRKSKKPERQFLQSQSPWADPDAPQTDPGESIPRPMTYEEMVFSNKAKEEPKFDMDTDLGA